MKPHHFSNRRPSVCRSRLVSGPSKTERSPRSVIVLPLAFGFTLLSLPGIALGTNLLVNGDFSQGLSGWKAVATYNAEYSVGTQKFCLPQQSGNPFLALNTYWGGTAYVEQTVDLPTGPSKLSFRTWGNLDPVEASVIILDTGGAHVVGTFTPPPTEWSEDPYDPRYPLQCTGNQDVTKEYDLSAYGGQTVKLRLQSHSHGTNGTFASFDDVVLEYTGELEVELSVSPAEVAATDTLTVKLTVTNATGADVSNVTPGTIETQGDGQVRLHSGPTPASVASLADGDSTTFTFEYVAATKGTATLSGSATGSLAGGGVVASDIVSSNAVAIGPFVKLQEISVVETDDCIAPGDGILLQIKFDKQGEAAGEVAIPSTAEFITALPPSAPLATGKGEANVVLRGRVADETNTLVYDNVIAGGQEGSFSLADTVELQVVYEVEGESFSEEFVGSPLQPDDSVWKMTYPNYSKVTGEPPSSGAEAAYYREGNIGYFELGTSSYLLHPRVRYWALKGTRYKAAEDLTPDEPGTAAITLSKFLGSKIPSNTEGESLKAVEVASYLDSGTSFPKLCCIGQSFALNAYARTLGLRAREVNNGLRYTPLVGYWWFQHATSEIWYDNAWHWYDLFYDNVNGGDARVAYPGFYCDTAAYRGVFRFQVIRSFHSTGPKWPTDFNLKGDGRQGDPYSSGWQFDTQAVCKYNGVHVITHSPVATLYIDSQGRRLGATGPVGEDVLAALDDGPLPCGDTILCEVPGGWYAPAGIPIAWNLDTREVTQRSEEQIAVPVEEFTGEFTLEFHGTGDGAFAVDIVVSASDSEEPPVTLYHHEGTVTTGEVVTMRLKAEATTAADGQSTAITVTPLDEGSDSGRELTPLTSGCGTGTCGSGMVTALVLIGAGLRMMRRGSR